MRGAYPKGRPGRIASFLLRGSGLATAFLFVVTTALAQSDWQGESDPNRLFVDAVGFYREADGTQSFVLVEPLVDGCMACASVGGAITFFEVGNATGDRLMRRPIGLVGAEVGEGFDGTRIRDGMTGWETVSFATNPLTLQYRLNLLGYEAGPMDGAPGPQTREVLMVFQAEHCVAPTGQVDAATARALGAADGFTAPCAEAGASNGAVVDRTAPSNASSSELASTLRIIEFSKDAPAMRNGQPQSVSVETFWEPRALAILTATGLKDVSVLPAAPVLSPPDQPRTGGAETLDRSTALAILRSEIFGGQHVAHPGSRTMRVRELDLGAFQEAVTTAIYDDDPSIRAAQIVGLAPIREGGHREPFDMTFVDQLRFGLDHGQRFVGLWQSGTASLPNQVWRIINVGVPPSLRHPSLDPRGTLISRISVGEVTGVFVAGVTAEAQFTLKAEGELNAALAEAARLGLRTSGVIEYPAGGVRRTQQFDPSATGATWTAGFRLYDDGWRLWNVR